jgi:PRTRC genetic system protein E
MPDSAFFQHLAPFLEGTDITITLKSKNGIISVSLLPRLTSASKASKDVSLSPILLTGTPQELDSGFIEAMSNPLTMASGLSIQLDEFQKSIQTAKEEKEKELKDAAQSKKTAAPKATQKGKPKRIASGKPTTKPEKKKIATAQKQEIDSSLNEDVKTPIVKEISGSTIESEKPQEPVVKQAEMFPVTSEHPH